MYDVMKHYIDEGLVAVYYTPHPDNFEKFKGKFFKRKSVVTQLKKIPGGVVLAILYEGMWMGYPINTEFYETYGTRVDTVEEIERKGKEFIELVTMLNKSTEIELTSQSITT